MVHGDLTYIGFRKEAEEAVNKAQFVQFEGIDFDKDEESIDLKSDAFKDIYLSQDEFSDSFPSHDLSSENAILKIHKEESKQVSMNEVKTRNLSKMIYGSVSPQTAEINEALLNMEMVMDQYKMDPMHTFDKNKYIDALHYLMRKTYCITR